jgi:hypothetical protein
MIPIGARVRLTELGKQRNPGYLHYGSTGVVQGYRQSLFDGRWFTVVRKDRDGRSGDYLEGSWEPVPQEPQPQPQETPK